MRKAARISFLITGACGLVLSGIDTAFADDDGFGEIEGRTPRSGGYTNAHFGNGFECPSSTRNCINGPVNSGNIGNAQYVILRGKNINNSGSPTNDSGLINSDNETHGAYSNSDNNLQHISHTR